MKSLVTLIFLIIISPRTILTQKFSSQEIYNSYEYYKEASIISKRLKHHELARIINNLDNKNILKSKIIGKSLEGREIYHLTIGTGKTKVLLWSQMHGDEPTATMALLDLFNFFTANDQFDDFRKNLLKKLEIHIIPMLNPDGAEIFKRRNALYIDLNRDAQRLEFPESRILKSLRDSLKPQFAFNLHDQNPRYSAGNTFRSASISFLAPAFNYEKEINDVRANTMKVIVDIYNELNRFIPGHIAKYNDDFEPRAFGDNFVKWGTSSVLIESGGWKNDEEKQFIRKLNFIALLGGLNSIATKQYKDADLEVYNNIPLNDNLLFDLLLRNLIFKYNQNYYKVDVGINRQEVVTKDQTQSYMIGKIEDWGDLSIYYGYDEYDMSGYEIRETKIYNIELHDINELNLQDLLKGGYGFVKMDNLNIEREYSGLPFNIILNNSTVDLSPEYEGFANFTIWKGNELKYNIINGFIYDIDKDIDTDNNGLIFK